MVYDAAFAGTINRDFLRLFSRTLVKEKKLRMDEPDDQVYMALDKQHRNSSTSPQGPARDFDLSLPLPSEDEMNSPPSNISPVQTPEAGPEPDVQENSKPVFKSYLEQILESRNRKSRANHTLAYDNESTEEPNDPAELRSVINTSKFIIENTLSGLPDSWDEQDQTESNLKLAEPVAFGLLHDDDNDVSSNESSEKENSLPVSEAPYRPARLPRIGLGNKTPENYDIQFDNIDHLDVPSWEPVPIYNDPESIPGGLDHVDTEEQMFKELDSTKMKTEPISGSNDLPLLESDSSQVGMILGHFTVVNEDIAPDEIPIYALPSPGPIARVGESPPKIPEKKRPRDSRAPLPRMLELPKNLVKNFVSVAQHLPSANSAGSPPRKKQKSHKIKTDILGLISEKSNEFLLQVMQDLGTYADHRNSDQINISDAMLFVNRIKSQHRLLGQNIEFPVLAQNVFPLELLMSLDNSLQQSVEVVSRKANSSKETRFPQDSSYTDD